MALAKDLALTHGARHFSFKHDNLTYSRNWTLNLCDALEKADLDIIWQCSGRADMLDACLLRRMAATGCRHVFMGIETGSLHMQRQIGKNLKLDLVLPTVRRIVDLGMSFTVSFIAGFPEESVEDLTDTLRLMMQLRCGTRHEPRDFQFGLVCPLKGSAIYDEYRQDLRFDGNYADMAYAPLSQEEEQIIRDRLTFFPEFHYLPNRFLSRSVLRKVPHLVLNLLPLRYTCWMLLHDSALDFPRCILTEDSMNAFEVDLSNRVSVTLQGMERVCSLLRGVLSQKGLAEHPIADIMRYDLALHKTADEASQECSVTTEQFAFEIQRWVKSVDSASSEPASIAIPRVPNSVMFLRSEKTVVAVRIPHKSGTST